MYLKKLLKFYFSCFICCFLTLGANAANIQFIDNHSSGSTDNAQILELAGKINKGDSDKLKDLLMLRKTKSDVQHGVLAWIQLNSPGGNMLEAIALADIIHENSIGTRVIENAECVSACALAFMAGTTKDNEGNSRPMRQLHPRGMLAFHAPNLPESIWEQLKDNDLSAAQNVEKIIYQAARSIVRLMRKHKWPSSLAEAALNQAADGFEIVDTVDEAGRWRIEIIHEGRLRFPGLQAYDFDPKWSPGAAAFCVNTMFWGVDKPAISSNTFNVPHETGRLESHGSWFRQKMAKTRQRIINALRTAPSPNDPQYKRMLMAYSEVGFGHPTNMAGIECPIYTNPDGSIFSTGWGSFGTTPDRIRAWQALPPDTKLENIDAALNLTEIFETYYPPKPEPQVVSRTVRVWDHNGSGMQSFEDKLTDGRVRFQIVYASPKSSLSKGLIRGGTVLFQGYKEDGIIRGDAYRFRRACKGRNPAYKVSGQISQDELHLTLTGAAPDIISGTCKTKGLRSDISAAKLYFAAKWQSYSNSVDKITYNNTRALPPH